MTYTSFPPVIKCQRDTDIVSGDRHFIQVEKKLRFIVCNEVMLTIHDTLCSYTGVYTDELRWVFTLSSYIYAWFKCRFLTFIWSEQIGLQFISFTCECERFQILFGRCIAMWMVCGERILLYVHTSAWDRRDNVQPTTATCNTILYNSLFVPS